MLQALPTIRKINPDGSVVIDTAGLYRVEAHPVGIVAEFVDAGTARDLVEMGERHFQALFMRTYQEVRENDAYRQRQIRARKAHERVERSKP